ncbi:MAG: type II secretion system protein GspG [Planctomycetes bacterium]|nr:type II secretion system protein GspG [Planctomycetota bacterium]
MSPPLGSSAQSQSQSASRPWIQFAILTAVLTLGGIALIRILKPAALQNLFSRSDPAEVARGKALNDIRWIQDALLVYASRNNGEYPRTLEALVEIGKDGKTYFGNQQELPLDPWKRSFLYEQPTPEHPKPRVRSLGADGQPGGVGMNADLDSDTL